MRTEPIKAIPRAPAGSAESAPRRVAVEGEISFDWGALALHAVHPVKVAILESLLRLQQPLSATMLAKILKGSGYSLGVVSHHLQGLAKWGAVELVEERQVKGVIEKTYLLPVGEEVPQLGLGRAVRLLREQAGLTQELLAAQAGVSASWLSQVEDGHCDPTWGDMRRLAAGLRVSMETLSELAGDFEEEAGAA